MEADETTQPTVQDCILTCQKNQIRIICSLNPRPEIRMHLLVHSSVVFCKLIHDMSFYWDEMVYCKFTEE